MSPYRRPLEVHASRTFRTLEEAASLLLECNPWDDDGRNGAGDRLLSAVEQRSHPQDSVGMAYFELVD